MKKYIALLLLSLTVNALIAQEKPYIIVLGVAQDGGYPHLGCKKVCCTKAWSNPKLRKNVTALAVVNPSSKKWWLLEATPDIKFQLQDFQKITNNQYPYLPEGVFLTHAHMGHYTGLAQFGREVMNTKQLNVYVMPKFKRFLESNGPWSQLVNLKNINLIELSDNKAIDLDNIKFSSLKVPHRDEYSETVGFKIDLNHKNVLFIPDIDKWSKWNKSIIEEVKKVDYAFLDATFFDNKELNNRPIAEVPHPFVAETIQLFENESKAIKEKIHFIHFNHTNPIMWQPKIKNNILRQNFNIAQQGKTYQ
ncbi:MAG: MBL fold metallo-hydrolase [Pedobacter sp.]|uniref:MBL fold metallo-hydrolase n=1 Tax=Pedobacter sp. TaxID=1411316 RepID=UPI00280753E3|nr:MBL fold metallo-hydrolase [Pedobacter sp.]MDQ8006736.1 MBL fold metallo-hydrolase [Pedobacter sp.]